MVIGRRQKTGATYITATDTGPVDLDEDVVRGFEFRDRALLVLDFEGGFEDEGEVLGLERSGVSIESDVCEEKGLVFASEQQPHLLVHLPTLHCRFHAGPAVQTVERHLDRKESDSPVGREARERLPMIQGAGRGVFPLH